MNQKKLKIVFLILLLFSGFLVRIWGLGFGLPEDTFHPDSPDVVNPAIRFSRGDFHYENWEYAPLTPFLFAITYALYSKIYVSFITILGLKESAVNTIPGHTYYLLGRFVVACLGTATILIVYKVGKRLFNVHTGLVAAVMLAFNYLHGVESHYAMNDVPMTFFVIFSFFFSTLIYLQGNIRSYLLAGMLAGMAFATKYNGGMAIVPLLLAHIFRSWEEHKKKVVDKHRYQLIRTLFGGRILVSILSVGIGFTIGFPQITGDFTGFWEGFKEVVLEQSSGPLPWYSENLKINGWLAYGQILWQDLGPILALFTLAAFLYAFFSFRRKQWLLLSFPLVYLLSATRGTRILERHMTVLQPFLLLLSASFLFRLFKPIQVAFEQHSVQAGAAEKKGKSYPGKVTTDRFMKYPLAISLSVLSVILLISYPAYKLLRADYFFRQEDTREAARTWIEKNIPEGSTIGLEWYSPILSPEKYQLLHIFSLADRSLTEWRKLGTDYLISSSLMSERFLKPGKGIFPQKVAFYNSLGQKAVRIKTFFFLRTSFLNPVITVYSLASEVNTPHTNMRKGPLAKAGNGYLYFLEPKIAGKLEGPELQKEGPFWLENRSARWDLVSPVMLKSMTVLVKNGIKENVLQVKTGWMRNKKVRLAPYEKKVIQITPRRCFPYLKYLYRLRMKSSSPLLVWLTFSPTDIGLALSELGKDEEAAALLTSGIETEPENWELRYALAQILLRDYSRLGAKKTSPEEEALSADAATVVEKKEKKHKAQELLREAAEILANRTATTLSKNYPVANYEAEDLPNQREGKRLPGARYHNPAYHHPGFLVIGPYEQFQRGSYLANFWMKVADNSSPRTVAHLDIVGKHGRIEIAERRFAGTDFTTADKYQQFTVPFFNDDESVRWEFRVRATGVTPLWVDRITIFADQESELREAQWKVSHTLIESYEGEKNCQSGQRSQQKANYISGIPDELIPLHKCSTDFSDLITFAGYTINREILKPGESFNITYYWIPRGIIKARYTVFVHFLLDNKIRFQDDHTLLRDREVDKVVKETREITIPHDVPAGFYTIGIGIWDPLGSGKRLPVTRTDLAEENGRIHAGTLQILSPEEI